MSEGVWDGFLSLSFSCAISDFYLCIQPILFPKSHLHSVNIFSIHADKIMGVLQSSNDDSSFLSVSVSVYVSVSLHFFFL